jgi:hypothetical protein
MAVGKKYWEVETPVEITTEKNVIKVYVENGKVQVFPRVASSKYGIGKGATVDLETMTEQELTQFQELISQAIIERKKSLEKA